MDDSSVGEMKAAGWFLLGSVVGGTSTALLVLWPLATVVGLLPDGARVALATLAIVVVAAGIRGWVELPRRHRQARQSLGEMVPGLGAFVFGVELGASVRTYTSSLALYLTLVPPVLAVSTSELALLGAAVGLGRGVVPIDRLLRKDRATWERRLGSGPWALRAAPTASLAVAAAWIVLTARATMA